MSKSVKLLSGSKRVHSFWDNEMPLTSVRGRILLSDPVIAKDLAISVRALKKSADEGRSFRVKNTKIISQLEKLKK